MNSCTYSGPDSDNLHREGTMCTSLTRNRTRSLTRGLLSVSRLTRAATDPLPCSASYARSAPYAPAARRVALYALAARSIRSCRSHRSPHVPTPLSPHPHSLQAPVNDDKASAGKDHAAGKDPAGTGSHICGSSKSTLEITLLFRSLSLLPVTIYVLNS